MTPAKRCDADMPEFKLGDFNDNWIGALHLRMFHYIEEEFSALEGSQKREPDPVEAMGKTLNLLERVLKLRRLVQQTRPKRMPLRAKRRGR
jgi:hypothetical protein